MRRTYEWIGGDLIRLGHGLIDKANNGVSAHLLNTGDVFSLGPHRLRVVEQRPWKRMVVVVRQRNLGTWLLYIGHRWSRVFDLFYRRFVLCLAIYELASYDPALIPSWRDVHVFRRNRG